MPWPDAIIVSDTLQPNGWALSVHVSKKKVCTCVCVCVKEDCRRGEGGRDANWNSFSHVWQSLGVWVAHTRTHIHTGPNKSGLCHMEAMCKTGLSVLKRVSASVCVCAHVLSRRALYSTRASSTDACNPMTCVWRCASDKDQFRTSTQTLDIIHLEENYSVMQRTPVF